MNINYINITLAVTLLVLVGYVVVKGDIGRSPTSSTVSAPAGSSTQPISGAFEPMDGEPSMMDMLGDTSGSSTCLADTCLLDETLEFPVASLSPEAAAALARAIDDEYKARATYEAVIEKLGSVRPFIMIIRSEEQHISMLKALYDKYGITPPEDPWTGTVVVPEALPLACAAGVVAERENAALYRDELLPAVAAYPDISSVFTMLMEMSQSRHMPAFARCSGGV